MLRNRFPDSTQVIFGMGWYNSDGATALIFDVASGQSIDSFSQPRPGGCTSTGNGNNCGQNNGVSWSPTGMNIAQAFGRNDEGFYIWFANIDPDQDGWNTTDQGDGKVDQFLMSQPNGMTLITMLLAIILSPLSNQMLAF